MLLLSLTAAVSFTVLAVTNVTLSWTQSPSPSVVGYRIYEGPTAGVYTQVVDAGSALAFTFSNISSTLPSHFAATAYDTNGLESQFSAEAVFVPGSSNNLPSRVQNFRVLSIQ